jgi:phage uncharacterized protein TIGR01671
MIKFRAKVKMPEKRNFARQEYVPEGQWVYGEPHTIDCPTPHIHTVDVGKQPIDKETICQFTGLHDKNGKEIYEGDILKGIVTENTADGDSSRTIIDKVEFGDGSFIVETWNLGWFVFAAEEIEVIGNIHDNPELMKGGEK